MSTPTVYIDFSKLKPKQIEQLFAADSTNSISFLMQHAQALNQQGKCNVVVLCNHIQQTPQPNVGATDIAKYCAIDAAVRFIAKRFDWIGCTPVELARWVLKHYN